MKTFFRRFFSEENSYSLKPFYLSYGALSGLLVIVFYATPLHDQIENKLFDVRTRIKPALSGMDAVALVPIGDEVLQERHGVTAASIPPGLAFQILRQTYEQVANYDAVSIVLLLYPNLTPYDHPEMIPFLEFTAKDPRVLYGVLGVDTFSPSSGRLPENLLPVQGRTFGIETFRERRQSTIRKMPLIGFRGIERRPLLAPVVAALYGRDLDLSNAEPFKSSLLLADHASVLLNFQPPEQVLRLQVSMGEASVSQDESTPPYAQSLIVGFTGYKERPINNDQLLANTPWQGEGMDPSAGVSIANLQAQLIGNLVASQELRAIPWQSAVVGVQTILMTLLSALAWRMGIAAAVSATLLVWIGFLYLQCLLMSFGNVFIPISETILFSAIATIGGGVWRVRKESMIRASEQAKGDAREQLARIHGRFLNLFTKELAHTNRLVQQKVENIAPVGDEDVYERLLSSVTEFDEYLTGIEQFASIPERDYQPVELVDVEVATVFARVITQMEARIDAANVKLELRCKRPFHVRADENYLEAILFNFVSNAVKYTAEGSDILLAAERKPGGLTMISVADRGPGIPEDLKQRIFEKFYRIQDERSLGARGHGLGLYLSSFFASKLGGRIEVKDRPGGGSIFELRLPS